MARMPRGLGGIVEEQYKRWLMAQRREEATREPAWWPVLTISRQYGARGAFLGHVVANRLGFSFWDRELLYALADSDGVPDSLLQRLDEHAHGLLQELIDAAVVGERGTSGHYITALERMMGVLSQHGSSVIVGRGGQALVPAESALHVRVVSPHDQRVEHIAMTQGLSTAEAAELVDRVDSERELFLAHHFGVDMSAAENYDLVVNTATLALHTLVEIIVAAYQAKFGRVPERRTELVAQDDALLGLDWALEAGDPLVATTPLP